MGKDISLAARSELPAHNIHVGKILQYFILVIYSVITLYPIYWIFITSFRNNKEIFNKPFSFPETWLFSNYASAWKTANLGTPYFNSMIVSIGTVVLTLIISTMAAYVLARLPFKGNVILFFAAISGIFIPQQAVLLPVFLLLKQLSLLNHSWTLIIVYVAYNLSLAIFIIATFLKAIPREIEEAAIMDGAGMNQTFFRIIIPICKPTLATAGIIVFLNSWNEFMFAVLFINKPAFHTLSVAMSSFRSEYGIQYSYIACGVIMGMLPVLIVFIVLQKQVIQGMAAGAVKG